MPVRRLATDEQLLESYARSQSIRVVGREFGMRPSRAHERLKKLGAIREWHVWTPERDAELREVYASYADEGRLSDLARRFGTLKTSVCARARRFGLTNSKRLKPYHATWKYITQDEADHIWDTFKRSKVGLMSYCKKKGFDYLGFSRAMKRFFADEWDHVIEAKAPKGSLYRRGRAFEYIVRDKLKAKGFYVMRSPQSKSPVDLVAIRHGKVLMVQCKRHGALGVEEWNGLFDLARSSGATPLLASFETGRGSLRLFELIGRKDGTKRPQPMVEITITDLEAAGEEPYAVHSSCSVDKVE